MPSLSCSSFLLIPSPSLPQSFPSFISLQSHHHHPRLLCDAHLRRSLSSLSLSNSFASFRSFCSSQYSLDDSTSSNEGTISVLNFEDFIEKDWSFLDSDNLNSVEEHNLKTNRIISAGDVRENSRVLVSIGTGEFVDQLVDSFPSLQLLLVVHDSLFALAEIKEKYDKVKCWQGELIYVPEKWASFDVVFLYYLPALPFELAQVFEALAARCLPGARLVISSPQGRETVEQQRKQYPDVVISDLPDKITLEKVSADYSFKLSEFVDEPCFYLAVLKFCKLEIPPK